MVGVMVGLSAGADWFDDGMARLALVSLEAADYMTTGKKGETARPSGASLLTSMRIPFCANGPASRNDSQSNLRRMDLVAGRAFVGSEEDPLRTEMFAMSTSSNRGMGATFESRCRAGKGKREPLDAAIGT